MKVLLIWSVIIFVCFFSFKDWFKSACVLIIMTGIYGHATMPSNTFGIQGLNPWNLLLVFVLLGYLIQKGKEDLSWELDTKTSLLAFTYVFIVAMSALRLLADHQSLLDFEFEETFFQSVSERFINRFKWIVPGILVFVGANTQERRKYVLWAIVIAYVLIAIVVISRVPIGSITEGFNFNRHSLKVLEQAFGWSRVNTAMMLGGGAWVALMVLPYLVAPKYKQIAFAVFLVLSFALALTGGRGGYLTWLAVGVYLTFLRWRKGVLIIPLGLLVASMSMPFVADRLLEGIAQDSSGIEVTNTDAATSGRDVAWPLVVDKISLSPWLGYGGLAMIRTGAEQEVAVLQNLPEDARGFPHPHNAYLRLLLDTGILGTLPILIFWIIVMSRALKLTNRNCTEEENIIGFCCSILGLSLLVSGITSQSFYPTQGSITLWAAMALVLRIYQDRHKSPGVVEKQTVPALHRSWRDIPRPSWKAEIR